MTETNYPKEIKALIKQIKKEGGYSEETGERLTAIVKEGGWLYGILYSHFPLHINTEDIVDFTTLGDSYATLQYETDKGIYVPLYTNENYAGNLADIVKLPNFPFHYLCKLRIQDTLDRAVASKVKGLIINPQLEGILIHPAVQN